MKNLLFIFFIFPAISQEVHCIYVEEGIERVGTFSKISENEIEYVIKTPKGDGVIKKTACSIIAPRYLNEVVVKKEVAKKEIGEANPITELIRPIVNMVKKEEPDEIKVEQKVEHKKKVQEIVSAKNNHEKSDESQKEEFVPKNVPAQKRGNCRKT